MGYQYIWTFSTLSISRGFYASFFDHAWPALSKAAAHSHTKPSGGVCKKSVPDDLSPLMRLRQGDFCI